MPIVDDPYTFGRIAAANAISDVYAMGGLPVMAIAILGWPIDKIPPEVASKVVEGGRKMCEEAGIPLAGGHSIDSPEPIFGLSVNGIVRIENLKRNDTAKPGDHLYLTKNIGVGILTTAEKKGLLKPSHKGIAASQMVRLNKVGAALGNIAGVNAMTDVTGFGLLGHLCEMADGSGLSAEVVVGKIPLIVPELEEYISSKSVPGGTGRNWSSYGSDIEFDTAVDKEYAISLLADPQTSGGLLISVEPKASDDVARLLIEHGLDSHVQPIGVMKTRGRCSITVI